MRFLLGMWALSFLSCSGADLLQMAKRDGVPRFGVVYFSNGGDSGAVPSDSLLYQTNQQVTVLGNSGSLTKSGYLFTGWNTLADGLGTNYAVGRTFGHPARDVSLYALWANGSSLVISGTTISQGSPLPTGALVIPGGITATDSGAFIDCTGLTSVTTPSTMTTLGGSSFMGCTALTSVSLNDGLVTIGDSAFQESGLVSIVIPPTVTTIGSSAFFSAPLTTAVIPPSVTTIGVSAFSGTSLTTIDLPPGLTQISTECFSGSALTSITIPSGVTTIGQDAFSNTPLASVVLPVALTSLATSSFHDCEHLTSLTIPAGVVSIGDICFQDCVLLANVYMLGASPPALGGSLVFDNCAASLQVHVPSAAALIAYSADPNWNVYTLVTP